MRCPAPECLNVSAKHKPKKGDGMNTNKLVVLFLSVLVVTTVIGMVLNNDAYWNIHNYGTILLSVICGILLLKQK